MGRARDRRINIPDPKELARVRQRLDFKPVDLREVVRLLNKSNQPWTYEDLKAEIEKCHVANLLRAVEILGIEARDPDVWMRAFAKLAQLFIGIGHLSIERHYPRTQAQSRTPEDKEEILVTLSKLRHSGMSQKQALQEIVRMGLGKDRPQRSTRGKSKADEMKANVRALQKHVERERKNGGIASAIIGNKKHDAQIYETIAVSFYGSLLISEAIGELSDKQKSDPRI